MKWSMAVMLCALVVPPMRADEPTKKLTEEERKELDSKWTEVFQRGKKDYLTGNNTRAENALTEALEIARRLYPKAEYPEGHPAIIVSLNYLALVLDDQQRFAQAESHYRASLNMLKDFYKGDHSNLAAGIFNLASFIHRQGRSAEAEVMYRDAITPPHAAFFVIGSARGVASQ
jgi:tetratricopeptide (TPR) repeat protein